MADTVLRRGQSGIKADMADTWRTRFGGAAKAQSRRTHGGQPPSTRPGHRGQPFILRENPTLRIQNYFGNTFFLVCFF